MSADYLTGAVLSFLIVGYLMYSVLFPEKF
ncbi:MAG: potassium-transporting ATPase subunit F [Firmicutes bacterium]|nr:potassium-transporting ATPase subunit F [Bacillota bacterium]